MKKMLPGDRKKWIERGKTLLLVFLVVCCLGLLYSVLDLYKGQVSIGTVFWNGEDSSLDNTGANVSSQNVVNTFWKMSQPDKLVIAYEGKRDTVKKTDENYDRIVETLNTIMKEAYFQKDTGFKKVSVKQWENALKGNAVYVKYPCERPAEFESGFYGTKETAFLRNVTAYDEAIFVPNVSSDRGVSTLIRDKVSGEYVEIVVDMDVISLKNVIMDKLEAGEDIYCFAYETNISNGSGIQLDTEFDEMILIPTGNKTVNDIIVRVPRVYQGGINFTKTTDFATSLINLFGYNPNTIRQYANSDGAIMFVGTTGSLGVYPQGKIEYKALGENEGVILNQGGQAGTDAYSVISGISSLMDRVFALCGMNNEKHHGDLKITAFPDMTQGQTVFKFDYFIDGVKILVDEDSAVKAIVKNGVLTEFKIWVKAIEKTDGKTECPDFYEAVDDFCVNNKQCRSITDISLVYRPTEDEKETSAVWEIQGE